MNRRGFLVSSFVGLAGLSRSERVVGQGRQVRVDLAGVADARAFKAFNRLVSRLDDGTRQGVRVGASSGEGVAFLPALNFTYGAIELDLRGKDVPQGSFLGVAFHGSDGSAHDAVYFRPFNFKATDPMSRSHAVQYHSLPEYTWQRLRAEQPDKYEHAVQPVPDPNDWFHARIVVENPRVTVFVNHATAPCLTVSLLNSRRTGAVGLWVGNGSGGDFSELTIENAAR